MMLNVAVEEPAMGREVAGVERGQVGSPVYEGVEIGEIRGAEPAGLERSGAKLAEDAAELRRERHQTGFPAHRRPIPGAALERRGEAEMLDQPPDGAKPHHRHD